jgi:GGDEF domain-containing protein
MPPPITIQRIAAWTEVLRQNCIAGLRSIGEYAPEIEPGDAQGLSADLRRLSAAISESFSAEESRVVQAGVRTALRAYRGQTQQRLGRMREEVRTVQAAIREFASGVSAGDANHLGGVQKELDTLKAAAKASDLQPVRQALGQACTGIRRSHAAFVRSQQMSMLQLQDEIRILKETIEAHQLERERDPDSGAWLRGYLDAEVRTRLAGDEPFSVLLLSIHNLEQLRAEHPPEALLSLFEALGKRLAGIVGGEAMFARWSPTAFAVLLSATGLRAEEIRDQVRSHLPGAYVVQAGGSFRTLRLDLSIAVVDPAVEYCPHQ